MNFSCKLQKLRKEKGLSQEELAHICNTSRQAVSKWETGTTMPESDKLILLSEIFDVSIDYLLKKDSAYQTNSIQEYTFSFEKICNLLLPGRKTIMNLYENAELYDVFYQNDRDEKMKNYWKWILKDLPIKTIHDCSIGTGQTTLGLNLLGYQLSGSDISKSMLKKCEMNARNKNISIKLTECDFRCMRKKINQKFDLVMSTSNSLPHVNNDDIKIVLKEMDSLIAPEGYLYIDSRNWDKILQEHQRFYFYDPYKTETQTVHQIQVWDYNLDGTITFHMLYTFEEQGKIVNKKVSSVYFYPVSRYFLEETILDMNYEIIREESIDGKTQNLDSCDWYYILARKNK